MEIILIRKNSGEWERMWDELGSHPLNTGHDQPSVVWNEGEVWKYMGSFRGRLGWIVHEFQHLHHPVTGMIQNLKFVTNNLSSEDIEKIIPIK